MKNVYHIAICDDEKLALNVLHAAVKNLMEEEGVLGDYEIFFTARDFYERTKTKTFDLIFLDVEMPQISGIKLGKVLRATHDAIKIIYVSGREDRVFETFEVAPFAFVRKSKLLKDLERAVKRWVKEEKDSPLNDGILLKKRNGVATFEINRIEYVESSRNYQKSSYFRRKNHRSMFFYARIRKSFNSLRFFKSAKGILDIVKIRQKFIVFGGYFKKRNGNPRKPRLDADG